MEAQWYGLVAARLLQDRLLLTALELHTELAEAGREEPQLREFFSNPANFERPAASIVRCPSQVTLDSLDLARLSEDSERNDDVAILEFELRKAKETINSLRANLTQAAECDSNSADIGYDKLINEDPIKPHERRALNFLIYEYLLQQDCKLTSITFSDEIPDQDFECWDDVGLNIPRPAGLVSIYRGDVSNQYAKNVLHKEIQTEDPIENKDDPLQFQSKDKILDTEDITLSTEMEEIAFLKKQILALETDKLNYQKLYDAALASLNSLTSPTSDVPSSETTLYNREDSTTDMLQSIPLGSNYSCDIDIMDDDMQPLPQTASQNYYGSSVSTNSLTPDRFELIGSEKNGGSSSHRDESNVSSYEPAVMLEDANSPKSFEDPSKRKASITTLDDTISFNEHPESEWEREQIIGMGKTGSHNFAGEGRNEAWINSELDIEYKSALMKFCDLRCSKDNVFFKDIPSISQPITLQRFVSVVSATLPKIIPNILLVKRDEVISLLICTIFLHPDQTQRDKLLQLLLNLKKKMEKEDRALIISGLVLLLQWNSELNCGIDSDLLGLFWEMLNSKSAEKRLMGAEASIALAPYTSLDLVNSLLLSMVSSMCDSNDSAIRKQGLLGALLICPTATPMKYSQLENIFYTLANDCNLSNVCIATFAPVLARTTLLNGMFHNEFCVHILNRLENCLMDLNSGDNTLIILRLIKSIIIFTLLYVIDVDIIKISKMEQIDNADCEQKFNEYTKDKPFHNPKYVLGESPNPSKLIQAFYNIMESDLNMTWPEKDWFINSWIKRLFEVIDGKELQNDNIINSIINVYETISFSFGRNFTKLILEPLLEEEMIKIEQRIIKLEHRNKLNLVLISIYLEIVTLSNDEKVDNITTTINKWCICCGMCSISPQILGIPLVRYSNKKPQHFKSALAAMWQCIVHSNEQVRAFLACLFSYLVRYATLTNDVLNSSIVPAIVTLVNDSSISVKCNGIVSLGDVVCQAKLSPAAHDKCWATLEGLVMEEKTNGLLGVSLATCIVKTFINIMKNENAHIIKVIPNLVMLCYSQVFSTDNISAMNTLLDELLPALQLATHIDLSEQFTQNSLLPALRKLENIDQLLSEHRSAIESLIHKITSNEQHKESITASSHHSNVLPGHSIPSLLANSESMGRRVSQMFQQSKPAMNLQNIFKKK